jgi:transposase
LYGWRLRLRGSTPKGFAPVRIAPEVAAGGTLEIDFVTGARMRISGAVDIAVMAAAVAALAQGRRR